jgi:sporulation integral membrane protein YtvI
VHKFYARHKDKIDKIVFVLSLLILVYLFFTHLFDLFSPFVFGFIFSLVLFPLRKLMCDKFKMNKGFASFLCLLLLIIALTVVSVTVVNKIISQARSFVQSVPFYVNELTSLWQRLQTALQDLLIMIPESIKELFTDGDFIPKLTSSVGSWTTGGTLNVVSNIPAFFVNMLLCFISCFFFLRDRERMFALLKSKTPSWIAHHAVAIKKGMIFAIFGYIKAQAILMSIVACIVIIGLIICGYPYALFVGILIALLDMLPLFGSGAVLWPWALYSFVSGNVTMGIGCLVIYLIIFITRQTLEPRILGSQIGIHPLLTLVALYVGLQLFGAVGLILGPALVIMVQAVYRSQKASDVAPDASQEDLQSGDISYITEEGEDNANNK